MWRVANHRPNEPHVQSRRKLREQLSRSRCVSAAVPQGKILYTRADRAVMKQNSPFCGAIPDGGGWAAGSSFGVAPARGWRGRGCRFILTRRRRRFGRNPYNRRIIDFGAKTEHGSHLSLSRIYATTPQRSTWRTWSPSRTTRFRRRCSSATTRPARTT